MKSRRKCFWHWKEIWICQYLVMILMGPVDLFSFSKERLSLYHKGVHFSSTWHTGKMMVYHMYYISNKRPQSWDICSLGNTVQSECLTIVSLQWDQLIRSLSRSLGWVIRHCIPTDGIRWHSRERLLMDQGEGASWSSTLHRKSNSSLVPLQILMESDMAFEGCRGDYLLRGTIH